MLSYRKLAMRVLGRPLHTGGGINSPRPASQRAAALVLTAALLTGAAFPAFAGTYYIEDGDIVISAGTNTGTNKVEQTGKETVENDRDTIITNRKEGTASSHTVTIDAKDEGDKVEVKFENVNIDASSRGEAAVSVTGKGDTTLELDGDNELKSGRSHAGLEHNKTDTSGKLKKILDVLHEETDTLQNQLDEKNAALAKAEKDRDAASSGKQAAEKALTDYKAQQTQKDTHAAKEAKFRELLKAAGVLDKYADRVVRLSGEDIDKLELDDKGEVKDAKKHTDSLKADWSDFVGITTTTGAKVDTPPTNTGSKMTKDQIFAIKDAGERQAAIAANADLFTGGGKD